MEQKLKQRLVGAIILVSLAVIFIPIILEGPDDEWSPRSPGMPEAPRMDYGVDMELALPPVETAESGEPESLEPAEPEDSGEPAVAPAVVPPVEPSPAQPAEPVKPEPSPAKPVASPAPAAPAPAAEAADKKTGTLPVPPPGWYIQVGSFSQRMNAEGLRDRLTAAGHTTRLQSINIGKAQVYRVLVGPATSRAAAEQQKSRLEKQQQIKGIVIEYPG
jgi:DedD protein